MARFDMLAPSHRAGIDQMSALLPAPSTSLAVRVLEVFRVIALRHLPGGEQAIRAAASAQELGLPAPGGCDGRDPCMLWRSPSEWLFIGTGHAHADALLEALPAAGSRLACALDQSAGSVLFELQGSALDAVLARLLDASAIPLETGQGSRARLGEVALCTARIAADRIWLLGDRSHDHYLAHWIAYAADAVTHGG